MKIVKLTMIALYALSLVCGILFGVLCSFIEEYKNTRKELRKWNKIIGDYNEINCPKCDNLYVAKYAVDFWKQNSDGEYICEECCEKIKYN